MTALSNLTLLTSLVLITAQPFFGAANGLPDTTENIHLGLVSDSKISDLSVLAGKVDYIFAASAASSSSVPPAGIYLDGYLTYDRDDTNKSISWFQSNHPDWIVYSCDESTVAYEFGNPNVPIDITNSAVQTYQLQEVSSAFASVPRGFAFNGMAWDNIVPLNGFPRCGTWQGSTWRQLYSGAYIDPAFTNSIVSWAQSIYSRMQTQFPGKGMSMNLSSGPTGVSNPPFTTESAFFPYVDFVWDERGYTGYGGGPITDADWNNTTGNLELLNQQNKAFSSVTSGIMCWTTSPYRRRKSTGRLPTTCLSRDSIPTCTCIPSGKAYRAMETSTTVPSITYRSDTRLRAGIPMKVCSAATTREAWPSSTLLALKATQ